MRLLLLHQKARGKLNIKSQIPLSSWTEQHLRTGRLVKDACSSSYSEWNADEKWSSTEWKSDEVLEVRTGRPVNEQPPGLFIQHTDRFIVDDDDMDSNTVTESDLSLKSRSFLRRVSDRVRKKLDQSSKDATQDSNKHSLIWRMFMTSTLEASIFRGKEYSENVRSIKKSGNNLTLKQAVWVAGREYRTTTTNSIRNTAREVFGPWVAALCIYSQNSRRRRRRHRRRQRRRRTHGAFCCR